MALNAISFVVPVQQDGKQILSGEPPVVDPVDPPYNFIITNNEHDTQTVAWSYADTNHTGFTIGLFNGTEWVEDNTLGPDVRTYTLDGLPASTLMKWRLKATNATDESVFVFVEQETAEAPTNPNPSIDLDKLHYYENFTDGDVGDNIDLSTSFTACSSSEITTANPYPGGTNRSAKSTVRFGTTGWTEWGFVYEGSRNGKPAPLKIGRYGESWYRCAIRYNSPWEWDDNGGANQSAIIKGFRTYRVYKSDGTEGSINCYPRIDRSGNLTAYVVGATSEQDRYVDWPTITRPDPDRWYMWEFYVKLDLLGGDNGGQGEMRVWQDGVPLGVQYWDNMLQWDGGYFNRYMMHTYWNGDAPRTQNCQYAHVTFAYRGETTSGQQIDHSPYLDRDQNGFPYIGMSVK